MAAFCCARNAGVILGHSEAGTFVTDQPWDRSVQAQYHQPRRPHGEGVGRDAAQAVMNLVPRATSEVQEESVSNPRATGPG
jgi:hypothetical protein